MMNNYSTSRGIISSLINGQQNIFIPDNNSLMHNTPQLNEAIYFPQHSQFSINPVSSHQPQRQVHSHSIATPNVGTGSSTVYDSRIARVYTASRNDVPITHPNGSNSDLLENGINSIPNISNTILIDNFAPQHQKEQTLQAYRNSTHVSQQQFQQHYQHPLQLQHSTVSRQQTQRSPEHTQQETHFVHSDMATTSSSSQLMQFHLPSAHQPIFLSTDDFVPEPTAKIPAYLPLKVNSSFPTRINEIYQQLPTTATAATAVIPPNSVATSNSPVVLDRINICINNHYADSNFISSVAADAGATCTNSTADTPSLPSPIIPSIQHSAIIDPNLLFEQTSTDNGTSTATAFATPVQSIINEPDSTTASHTPPSTPDNTNSIAANVNAIQSPSTSSTARLDESFKSNFISDDKLKNDPAQKIISSEQSQKRIVEKESNEAPLNQKPQNQDLALTVEPKKIFAIGDDVFVRIDDNRLYLGTVIDSKYQRYRVRFDDSSEMWCSPKEMRKFGICDESTSSAGKKCHDDNDTGTLCVACKKRDLANVEICERCGRGYHQKCTTETSPGSGEWICKRCSKSMKVDPLENNCNGTSRDITPTPQQQLPYDIQSLHWDSKHRVNEEQIYCYCGKTGQFDYNMLQCCKCLNWYHTGCVQDFRGPMLRGDGFFVFCCAICSTNSKEFLRRLKVSCVDFLHLVIYNLSAQKKQQHHKYHHLIKDIYPFILSVRQTTAFPEEWLGHSDEDLKDIVLTTLKGNVERFICGRELKRDYYFYGLRNNGPPASPCMRIENDEEINEKFINEKLKLKLCKRALENSEIQTTKNNKNATYIVVRSDKDDTDGKFTSDDEIPIKQILEKEKVKSIFEQQENQNEISEKRVELCENENSTNKSEIKSHKRKAFTLSRPYKETMKRYTSTANCESSSDENSSSSRGTSLDLIIPPPKDFLGTNNPFRNDSTNKRIVDKKEASLGRGILGSTIKNSVVNASALDFCSNLAALKNAGIFPNLNTTNFARAAGQPRMVRTIKRRLSARDIMIGPNQEVRRRRTRRLSSNVEVISTTTINPISNFFPINAITSNSTKTTTTTPSNVRKSNFPILSTTTTTTKMEKQITPLSTANKTVGHGRRLRLRTQKSMLNNSRRSSLSGASTSSSTSSSSGNATPQTAQYPESAIMSKLQQTVNNYFGVGNLITTGEQFSIHAKREMSNGQIQLLIEWGGNDENAGNADSTNGTETAEKISSQENS